MQNLLNRFKLSARWLSFLNSPRLAISSVQKPDKLYEKIIVEVQGNDEQVLASYSNFFAMAANELGVSLKSITSPPRMIERWTVLKSAFVHKKHRVQYETRTYYRQFDIERTTGSTADTFLEYTQRNLPEGVAMKVDMFELSQLPSPILSDLERRDRRVATGDTEKT